MNNKRYLIGYILIGLHCLSAISSHSDLRADTVQETIEVFDEHHVHFLQCEFVDLLGRLHSYTVHRNNIKSALSRGVNVDGSSIAGYTAIAQSDILLKPDLDSVKILPWTNGAQKSARVICDVHQEEGAPLPQCPRQALKKAMQHAHNLEFKVMFSCELEFFLIKNKAKQLTERTPRIPSTLKSLDTHHYCAHSMEVSTTQVTRKMISCLEQLGLKPEKTHHEVAPGQHEITLACAPALEAADNVITAKSVICAVARAHGYTASFMPKPFTGHNGSGMHTNYSLRSIDDKQNLFFDEAMPHYFSEVGQQFIAGNLALVRDMTALFNPIINSYKRLIAGFEAPVYISWGNCNRSTLIRIPSIGENEAHLARAELRSPDPTANPYLLFACIIESGLAGIECNFPAIPPTEENLFRLTPGQVRDHGIEALPSSLEEAVSFLGGSSFMRLFLGEELIKSFVALKEEEILAYRQTVTDWERQYYAGY